MVTILPPERTPFDVLGRDIGAAMQSVLPQAVQRGYERQLGMNALSKLETALKDKSIRGDPYKVALEFAKAGAQNPNLQRSLGPLMQAAMSQDAAGQFGSGLSEPGDAPGTTSPVPAPSPSMMVTPSQEVPATPENVIPSPQAHPMPSEVKVSPTDIDSIANQYIGEVRPDLVNPSSQYGAINTFDAAIKQDLTPEEEGNLRNRLLEKYKNPAVVDSVVQRIREGVRNKYNESLDKYKFDKDKLDQIQNKWTNFTAGTEKRLEPHLSKYGNLPRTQEVLKNKYNQYAGKLQTNLTPEQMHTNAMELLQRDINKLDALHAAPSMPPVRTAQGVKDYIDTYKSSYKDLYDQGFGEALREDAIINKDMGIEEMHSMIWGDQTSKPLLNSIYDSRAPVEYYERKKPYGIPAKEYNKNYPKEREKYIEDVSKKLMKLSDKDDLVLARAMVLDQGGEVKDFVDALNKAVDKGLKLSAFQKSQLQEITIPRVPPLWEVFGPKAMQPFINYLRGKK